MNRKELKLNDPQSDTISSILGLYPEVKQPDKLTYLLHEHLERRCKNNDPFELLLYTFNNSAGVGEFKHLVEFFSYYRQVLQEWKEVVTLRALCVVHPEKINAVRQQLQYLQSLTDQEIYQINPLHQTFDEKVAANKRFIFWIDGGAQRGSSDIKLIEQRELLGNFVKKHQATVNVSTSLEINCGADFNQDDIFQMSDLKTCYKQCINEYGHKPVFYTRIQNHNRAPQTNRLVYDAYAMGVQSQHSGLKFNTHMINYSISGKKPEQLLNEIDSKPLFSFLTESKTAELYCKENNLYFGYLQTTSDAEYFIITALAISDKSHVDIITNLSCWKTDTLNFLKDPILGNIKKITVLTNKQQIIAEIKFNNTNNSSKEIRIIDLGGISEHDKEILESVAQIDASSGDNSHSAQISGGVGTPKFPFFQSRPWTVCFFVDIIRNLKKNFNDCHELIGLFSRFIGMGEGEGIGNSHGRWRNLGSAPLYDEIIGLGKEEYKEYVTTHQKKITEQFHRFCRSLYHEFNVIHEQRHILIRALISSILMKGNDKEQRHLLDLMPSWSMNNTNFVFFAAASENWRLMETLKRKDTDYFQYLLREKHCASQLSPFSLALEKIDSHPLSTEGLKKIMSYGFSIEEEMSLENFIAYAVRNNVIQAIYTALNATNSENFSLKVLHILLTSPFQLTLLGEFIDLMIEIIDTVKINATEQHFQTDEKTARIQYLSFKIHSGDEFKLESIETDLEIKGRSKGHWVKLKDNEIDGIFFEKKDNGTFNAESQLKISNSNYNFGINNYYDYNAGRTTAVYEYLMILIANSYLSNAAIPARLMQDTSRHFSLLSQKGKEDELLPTLVNLQRLLPRLILRKILLRDSDITTENFIDTQLIDLTDCLSSDLPNQLLTLESKLIPFEIINWLKLRPVTRGKTLIDLPNIQDWHSIIAINHDICMQTIMETIDLICKNAQNLYLATYRQQCFQDALPYLGYHYCEDIIDRLKESEKFLLKLTKKLHPQGANTGAYKFFARKPSDSSQQFLHYTPYYTA